MANGHHLFLQGLRAVHDEPLFGANGAKPDLALCQVNGGLASVSQITALMLVNARLTI
jgi:hypothetical protein